MVESSEQVELSALHFAVVAGIAEEGDDLVGREIGVIDVSALVVIGQEGAGPGPWCFDGVAGCEHDVGGQVAVFGAQAVAQPAADTGHGGRQCPAVHQVHRGVVVGVVRVASLEHTDVVDDFRDFRKQVTDDHSAVASRCELPNRRQQSSGNPFGPQGGSFGALSLVGLQCRLGVEEVALVGTAVHEQLDDSLGLAAVVRG